MPADRLLQSQILLSSGLITRLSGKLAQNSNIIVSPAGILDVVSLISVGADPKMGAALLTTVGLSSSPGSEVNGDLVALREALSNGFNTATANEATFDVGNAVIVDPAIKPNEAAVAELEKAGAKVLISSVNDANAIDQVNKWIAERTKHLISDLIDHTTRNPGLLLANALYFKGRWSTQFSNLTESERRILRAWNH
jgi:serine protease inhibitor